MHPAGDFFLISIETNNTQHKEIIVGTNRYKLPALESLALCSGDAVPSTKGETSKFGAWEMLLDDEGKEVNVNEGIIAKKDDDKYVKDCRLFLFAKRHNGNIKQGAEIIRGVVSEKAGVGDLYISE